MIELETGVRAKLANICEVVGMKPSGSRQELPARIRTTDSNPVANNGNDASLSMHKTQTIRDAQLNHCLFINSTLLNPMWVHCRLRQLLPVSLICDSGGLPQWHPFNIILEALPYGRGRDSGTAAPPLPLQIATHFCRPYGREKNSTRVLKTEGRGNSSILFFFLRVGQRAGPYFSPHSHPYGGGRGSSAERSSAREKREVHIVEYLLIPLGCIKNSWSVKIICLIQIIHTSDLILIPTLEQRAGPLPLPLP